MLRRHDVGEEGHAEVFSFIIIWRSNKYSSLIVGFLRDAFEAEGRRGGQTGGRQQCLSIALHIAVSFFVISALWYIMM